MTQATNRTRPSAARPGPEAIIGLLVLLLAAAATAGVKQVDIELPIRPKLSLAGNESVLLAPFLIGSRITDERSETNVDVDREFRRYLHKQLNRQTKLEMLPIAEGVRLPSASPASLRDDMSFWRELADEEGANLVISGLIDFEVEDRAGYQREEYVSPVDGRTYYRQVFVEETGFRFDVSLWAIDGRTGEVIHEENMRTFKTQKGRSRDALQGLFDNLFSLENRILSVFVSREVKATRYIFGN